VAYRVDNQWNNGFTGNMFDIHMTSFDQSTMVGSFIFRGPNSPGVPAHDQARDLITYTGTLGNGTCVPSGNLCANVDDCPSGETCNTGTCNIGGSIGFEPSVFAERRRPGET